MLLGIGVSAVRHRRNQLRISLPARLWKVTPPKPWPAEEIAMLGKSSDAQVARRLGRSVTSVKTRRLRLGLASSCHRWTPAEDVLLGKFPDETLARRLGRTVMGVQARRAKLGCTGTQAGIVDHWLLITYHWPGWRHFRRMMT